jgi:hypothetical protein
MSTGNFRMHLLGKWMTNVVQEFQHVHTYSYIRNMWVEGQHRAFGGRSTCQNFGIDGESCKIKISPVDLSSFHLKQVQNVSLLYTRVTYSDIYDIISEIHLTIFFN